MVGSSPGRLKTKDYKICICCFTAKQAVLRSKSKDCLAQNNVSEWSDMSINVLLAENNVSEWSDMSTRGLLAQNNVSEWSDMSINVLLAQNNVSEWSDMSTHGLRLSF